METSSGSLVIKALIDKCPFAGRIFDFIGDDPAELVLPMDTSAFGAIRMPKIPDWMSTFAALGILKTTV